MPKGNKIRLQRPSTRIPHNLHLLIAHHVDNWLRNLRIPHLHILHLVRPHPQLLELPNGGLHRSEHLLGCCSLAAPLLCGTIKLNHLLFCCLQGGSRGDQRLGGGLLRRHRVRVALLQANQHRQPRVHLCDGLPRRPQLLVQPPNTRSEPVHRGPSSGLLKLRHSGSWLLQDCGQGAEERPVEPFGFLQEGVHPLDLLLHLLFLHCAGHELGEGGLCSHH
mmetsp:Transcript_49215/g.111506  ORF Transcript_49215/g.111506 Transcript_49215/m.111506 type:complete len:220 (-) Transcript_49215:549-1208(-)